MENGKDFEVIYLEGRTGSYWFVVRDGDYREGPFLLRSHALAWAGRHKGMPRGFG